MPKKELIKDLSQISSLPLGKSKKFLKTLVSVLSQQLAEDKKVLIKNLGTFKLKKRVARTIKNPKTKQEYQIPERKVPVFIVSFNLKKSIGKNYISNEPKSIPTEPLPAHISEKLIPIRQLTNKTPTNQSALKPAANPELKPKFKPEPKPAPTQEQKKSFLFRNIFGGRKKLPPAPTHIQPQPQPQIKFSPQLTTKPIIVKPYQPSSKLISETEPESKELTLAHPSAKGKVPKNIKQAQNEIISSLKKVPSVKSQINYLDLKQKKIPKEILVKIPEYIAKLYQAVPVEEKDGKLIVAMVDPEDYQAIEFIKKKTGLEIKTYLATQEDIGHVLEQYPGLEGEIEKEIKKAEIPKELKMAEKKIEEEDFTKTEAPTSRAVNSILKRAVIAKASDVHIEPYENEVVVRFRIDGVLQKIISLPKSIHQAVISRIKILSNMRIDETRLPQDGRFEMKVGRKKIDFRVSVFPTSFGEKSVMRILDKSGGILTLKELGVRGRAFDLLEESIKKSHGLVLVTGPTGSGKSTTLYAVLMELNQVGVNIVTLEDPVEYQIPGINQGQVRADIGFTFAKGLRSILRQDPDIVMVGEIRDLETAEMAVHAALTGHVVLSTLHTNDAAGAIPRLIDMGIEPFLVTSSVNSIIAQRLTRKICENCKEKIHLADEIINEIKEEISHMPEDTKKEISSKELTFYKGKGCDACDNLGYKGRVGIFELFNVTEGIKELSLKKVSSSTLEDKAISEGMLTMKQDGILKALDGITTIEEVWRVTRE